MRDLFDMPSDICYLNAAYMTPLTKKQKEIGAAALGKSAQPWTMTLDDFFDPVEDVRSFSAGIMGVSAEDIAIVASASYGIATAAKNLPLTKGQGILVLEGQFPSNIYEWQKIADEIDGTLVFVQEPEDDDWTRAIEKTVADFGGSIGLFALANVHWSSGALIDLHKISALAKRVGAYFVLDLTQSLGAMPTDLSAIDPDFAVAAGYKWMFGPYGLGVMYVAPRHQQGQSLEQNWINRKNSEDFAGLVNYQPAYQAGARRFDVGERSNFILMPIFREGLRQLLDWGVDSIADRLARINDNITDSAVMAGFRPIDARLRGPHMMGIHMNGRGGEILDLLNSKNILVSLRGDILRISPHVWTTEQDVEHFATVLKSVGKL